jgi:hypothetical protein
MRRAVRSNVLSFGVCLIAVVVKSDVVGMPLYAIVEPHLSCAQATQLATQTIERLGYALTISVSTPEQGTTLTALRTTANRPDELTVTISCDSAGARIEAVPDLSPCEQANQRVTMGMAELGFTLTSNFPARTGSRGFLQGMRNGPHGQETVTATIICGAEAIWMDMPADSPLLKSSEYLQPISDVRRGFFALFKPMAATLLHGQ